MTESSQVDERGEPAVRTLAMPADTKPSGDICGGSVLAPPCRDRRYVACQTPPSTPSHSRLLRPWGSIHEPGANT
jgi:hypothetical protein